VLTCARSVRFAESQHRQIAKLRRAAPDPQVEIHPDAAADRAIAAGDWVRIVSPNGAVRARARLDSSLDPGVVSLQHGWWQGCAELGLPWYPPYDARTRPFPGTSPAERRRSRTYQPLGYNGLPVLKMGRIWLNKAV
jgi:hypothetical protein